MRFLRAPERAVFLSIADGAALTVAAGLLASDGLAMHPVTLLGYLPDKLALALVLTGASLGAIWLFGRAADREIRTG